MYEKIFFDSTEHFQWASVAAVLSFLTFISSVVSIFLTNKQAKANREANTLVKKRLDELNRLRDEITTATLQINSYISKNNNKKIKNKFVQKTDDFISSLELQFGKVTTLLYKEEQHVADLIVAMSTNQIQLINLNKHRRNNELEVNKLIATLTEILIRTNLALNDYTNKEQETIRKSL